jgi:hypothetical protein
VIETCRCRNTGMEEVCGERPRVQDVPAGRQILVTAAVRGAASWGPEESRFGMRKPSRRTHEVGLSPLVDSQVRAGYSRGMMHQLPGRRSFVARRRPSMWLDAGDVRVAINNCEEIGLPVAARFPRAGRAADQMDPESRFLPAPKRDNTDLLPSAPQTCRRLVDLGSQSGSAQTTG